jgi:hypothetical protein
MQPYYQHKCHHCEKKFMAKRSDAKYCNATCRSEAHKLNKGVAEATPLIKAQAILEATPLIKEEAIKEYKDRVIVCAHCKIKIPKGVGYTYYALSENNYCSYKDSPKCHIEGGWKNYYDLKEYQKSIGYKETRGVKKVD